MSARSKARRRALDALFESEVRGVDPVVVITERAERGDRPVNEYAVTLVSGVVSNQLRIDELLSTYSQGWTLDRMPAVDRNVLRLGTYELLWCEDVPDAVVISEAVNMVRELSTDDSPGFVNGLLARLLELKPTLSV